MPPVATLLLAQGEPQPSDPLLKHLQTVGYQLILCDQPDQLLPLCSSAHPDLVLLAEDLGLARAIELCEQLLAAEARLPLLALAAGDDYSQRVQLLRAGADDALATPYALDELLARLEALLRRTGRTAAADGDDAPLLVHRDLSVNTDQRAVLRADAPVKLTVKEYDLLLYLLRHVGQVMPRQQILHAVWGSTWTGDDNLLDVYIRYLRKKIEKPELEPLIHTARGVGFMLN